MSHRQADDKVSLRQATVGEPALDGLRQLYVDSFPPEERREWADIARRLTDCDQPLRMMLIDFGQAVAGFVTFWQLTPSLTYIEHLVVDPSFRGRGIGGKTLEVLAELTGSVLVLEVELPDAGIMAQRRIAFYKRHGFVANSDFVYIQPPYGPGLDAVPLMLMTRGKVDLRDAAARIHREVYGVG